MNEAERVDCWKCRGDERPHEHDCQALALCGVHRRDEIREKMGLPKLTVVIGESE